MPGPYGITAAGFTPKPQEDIQAELETGVRGVLGAETPVHPESLVGMLIGILAGLLASVWQALNAVYNSAFRASAAGVALDNVGSLTVSPRRGASYSRVDAIATGTNGTVIPAGRIVSVTGTGIQFTNLDPITIDNATATEWRAVDTGPQSAPSGTLTTIETPVVNWTGISNAADQRVLGANLESDAEYRLRQEVDLGALGSGSPRGIRARVSRLANVVDAYVFENDTDTTDANGVPPHSFETVVDGGDDQTIAQTIYDNKQASAGTYGTTTSTVTDASGASKTVKWSRPVDLNIWITVDVKVDPATFPDDGVDQIKQALAFFGDLYYRTGSAVIASKLIPVIFGEKEEITPIVTGVTDVVGLPFIGLAASPVTSTTIVATNRQKARLDTSRIVVNLV